MQAKNLLDILARQGFKADGPVHHLGTSSTCSVYLGYGEDSLIVDRVSAIEVAGEIAIVLTQRQERYAVEVGDVRAVRVTPDASGPGY